MSSIGLLRDIQNDELELMRSWRNAPGVREKMYTRHEISAEEHSSWWQRTRENANQRYFMYESADMPLGIVAFNGIDQNNKNSFWAFYASPDAPRGTGSRMEFLALEHAFNELELRKLNCEVLSFNTPVIKLHEKFGFQIEGVFRKNYKIDADYVDIVRLGMLREEWESHRDKMISKIVAESE